MVMMVMVLMIIQGSLILTLGMTSSVCLGWFEELFSDEVMDDDDVDADDDLYVWVGLKSYFLMKLWQMMMMCVHIQGGLWSDLLSDDDSLAADAQIFGIKTR